MDLLGDLGHIESCFYLFKTVLVSVQDCSTVCANTYHRLRNRFRTHLMVLLGDKALVEAHFGLFGDNANLGAI
jgi:hypothetical protein